MAEETGRSLLRAGSTTFRRQDLSKGFEPDSCFYIGHVQQVERVTFHVWAGKAYVETATSRALPPLTAQQASLFVDSSFSQESLAWLRRVREWIRVQAP